MIREDLNIFIKNAKEKYRHIGHVECPAFRGEKVYFNRHGFGHLLRKQKMNRNISQQIRRLKLIDMSVVVVSTCRVITEHRLIGDHRFWSLEMRMENKIIKVIIRQISNSELHFFSVMDKKCPKTQKIPKDLL